MCMDLDGSNTETLVFGFTTFLNATPSGLFFSTQRTHQLEFMPYDRKTRTTLTEGTCVDLCITRDWIIYRDFDDNGQLWALRVDGSIDRRVEDF